MKKHLPLILLAVMAFAASCTPDTPSYVDTVVGKYYGYGISYDINGSIYYRDTGYLWIRKIENAEDRFLADPGSWTFIQDVDTPTIFRHERKSVITFSKDTLRVVTKLVNGQGYNHGLFTKQ